MLVEDLRHILSGADGMVGETSRNHRFTWLQSFQKEMTVVFQRWAIEFFPRLYTEGYGASRVAEARGCSSNSITAVTTENGGGRTRGSEGSQGS